VLGRESNEDKAMLLATPRSSTTTSRTADGEFEIFTEPPRPTCSVWRVPTFIEAEPDGALRPADRLPEQAMSPTTRRGRWPPR
jgi:hypothetical protein